MKTEAERTCIVTREAAPKAELMRFVVGPDGAIVADISGKLPGRGMYVTASKLLIGEAIAKRLFSKAAQQQVSIPEDFLANIEAQLMRRMADSLSLARKAGQVITGFEKVEKALKNGEIAALVHAADAADDGVRKLRESGLPTFQELPREVLSAVLGRENAVHAAVLHGPAAEFFITCARRFAFFLQ